MVKQVYDTLKNYDEIKDKYLNLLEENAKEIRKVTCSMQTNEFRKRDLIKIDFIKDLYEINDKNLFEIGHIFNLKGIKYILSNYKPIFSQYELESDKLPNPCFQFIAKSQNKKIVHTGTVFICPNTYEIFEVHNPTILENRPVYIPKRYSNLYPKAEDMFIEGQDILQIAQKLEIPLALLIKGLSYESREQAKDILKNKIISWQKAGYTTTEMMKKLNVSKSALYSWNFIDTRDYDHTTPKGKKWLKAKIQRMIVNGKPLNQIAILLHANRKKIFNVGIGGVPNPKDINPKKIANDIIQGAKSKKLLPITTHIFNKDTKRLPKNMCFGKLYIYLPLHVINYLKTLSTYYSTLYANHYFKAIHELIRDSKNPNISVTLINTKIKLPPNINEKIERRFIMIKEDAIKHE